MAYLLAFKMDGAWFVNKIIKFIGSLLNTSKPNIIEQPQPQPQPQPVQQNLLIEPMSSEQTSFSFDDPAIDEKSCPNCKRLLPFTSFRASSKHEDGLTKWCGECLSAPRTQQSNKNSVQIARRIDLKQVFIKTASSLMA